MEKLIGLPPVLPKSPVLLLLGSMPSSASLEQQKYYAYPRNHFWPLMACVMEEELPDEYSLRLDMLRRNRIALWDVVRTCERKGSLDQNISNEEPNDIVSLLKGQPTIRAVVFNGAKAQAVYDRYFARLTHIEYIRLPSSSPVPGRVYRCLEDKISAWQQLSAYLK
ncbi:DNA-deoxyinosine glycosylase [Eubacteriales bacterium OttesenSCG-928-K08]|nr:DNA-deoxyinosine glycosylase [Eubacteriales bacterium OttesenSCG-928-K08]